MLETRKNELHENYRLSTADTSQVCDGSSWQLLRSAAVVKSTADEIAHKLAYRPIKSRWGGNNGTSRRHDAFEEKLQDEPFSFLPRASLTDDDSMGFLELSEKTNASESIKESSISHRSRERRASMSSGAASTPDLKHQPATARRSSDSDASKIVVMRKLSRPMHRSMSSNSLSGIMRPARYSSISNNLAVMDSSGERDRINSSLNLNTLRETPKEEKLPRATRTAWVAHGVEFSKNMEVYVFKK